MKDCTNGGCQCTPNQSISCTVNNCAHHCQDSNYCGLDSPFAGTTRPSPPRSAHRFARALSCTQRFPSAAGPKIL